MCGIRSQGARDATGLSGAKPTGRIADVLVALVFFSKLNSVEAGTAKRKKPRSQTIQMAGSYKERGGRWEESTGRLRTEFLASFAEKIPIAIARLVIRTTQRSYAFLIAH